MKKSIRLVDLDCANCAAKMEAEIGRLDGVTQVSVNFMRERLVLEAPDERFDEVLAAAEKIIQRIEPDVTLTV